MNTLFQNIARLEEIGQAENARTCIFGPGSTYKPQWSIHIDVKREDDTLELRTHDEKLATAIEKAVAKYDAIVNAVPRFQPAGLIEGSVEAEPGATKRTV